MNRLLFVLISVVVFSACHPPEHQPATGSTTADTTNKTNYVPVQDLLQSEIAEVDSTPYRIMLYHIRDGKKDSLLLHPGEFDVQAKAFLVPGLDSTSVANRFTETSFMDQTTGMLTFTYATKDTLMGLRRIDILLQPTLNIDKLQSIYLEVSARDNDSLKVKKMSWLAGKHFSIVELVHPPQGASFTRETRVIWND